MDRRGGGSANADNFWWHLSCKISGDVENFEKEGDMEALLFFVFMGLVFGGMYSILALGYRSIEVDRAKSENAQSARPMQVLEEQRFFAKAPVEKVPLLPSHLINRLEHSLQTDYAGAALFASQPSKEGICSNYSAYVDAVAGELERHIQRESAATIAFASKPSLKRLYVDSGRSFNPPGPESSREVPLR
jgi:hypothetical protein